MGTMVYTRRSRVPRCSALILLVLPWIVACGDETPAPLDAAGPLPDAGTPADAPPDGCVAQPFPSDERDIDILFVMSTSASMATIDGDGSADSRWATVSKAVTTFVAGRSGQPYGAGLLFFPMLSAGDGGTPTESCAAADYEILAASIAPLDESGGHGAAIEAALETRSLAGGNTLTAALTGGLRAAARAKERTGHVIQTVLVTDGTTDPCGGDITSAVAVAGEAFQRDRLETYVLGVGPNATNLDPIAVAGGTMRAYSATGNDGVAAALTTLGATMRRCHYFLPSSLPSNALVRINFLVDPGKNRQQINRTEDGTSCTQGQGWFYNSNTAPAYVIFCPVTCDALLERPELEVSGELWCFTAND